jgi:hypothetical protein
MPAPPEASFVPPRSLTLPGGLPGRNLEIGLSRPRTTDDGWWLTHVWAVRDGALASAADITAPAEPPAGPPPAVLGTAFSTALAGLIAEEGGRQLVRIRFHPAADPGRPWERPLIAQVAIAWDPIRVARMRPEDLAAEVLAAFARAIAWAAQPT